MTLRNRAFGHLGAVAAMSALAAACTSPTPAPAEPTPTPTQSSPAASSTPPETQLERQTRLDFEAAEKAYRTFHSEYNKLAVAGGSDGATTTMKATAGGAYLKTMTEFLQARKREGWRSSNGVKVSYVRTGQHSVDRVILIVCEDGSDVKLLDKMGKEIRKGTIQRLTLTARPVEAQWKVVNGSNKAVESCAA